MFASHKKSKFWSEKNTISSDKVALYSHNKYWFNCDKIECGHPFEMALNNVVSGSWCLYCANKKLCDDKGCNVCFNKSFASHTKAEYWNYEMNDGLTPRQLFKGSSYRKFWFNCNECRHKFDLLLKSVTKDNHWCSYCTNQKLCEENCDICYQKSFASHPKVQYWSIKNNINPRYVFKGSDKKYTFDCPYCDNEYRASLCRITGYDDVWCPCTINKTETKLFNTLVPFYPQLKKQFNVKWCKNKKCLPFDFVLENECIILELDGGQHFRQVSNWTPPEITRKNDIYKMQCANTNKYSVIRILQEDVWHNRYDWLTELKNMIEHIIANGSYLWYIFLHENEEYSKHIEDFNINNNFEVHT
jgi:very-short-patch-repair endonuclease